MKIQKLNFLAFGPFTEKLLDFSGEAMGLHIIYGPNEAGKSSALRGLKGLLYGIPARTSDNFLHENKHLRVSGRLSDDNGHVLEIVRRKGNVDTLLNTAGDPLEEALLSRMMQGMSAEVFDSLFGINHDALVHGGQEILDQKGEVGQALFSASLGSTSLHQVLDALEEECSTLFKPGGSKQAINALIREYGDNQKAIKAISLSSKDWERKYKELEATSASFDELVAKLSKLKAQLTRLQRARRALPKFAQRIALIQRMKELEGVVILSEDFGERRKQALAKRENATTTAGNAATSLEGLEEKLEETTVNQDLLEAREEIEDLYSRLGGHAKAMRDLPALEAQRDQLQADATGLVRSINPDIPLEQAEGLRPVLKKRPRITELGNIRNLVIDNLERTKKEQHDTEKLLEKARAALGEMSDARSPDQFKARLASARKRGDLDETIRENDVSLAATEQRWTDFLAALTPAWSGTLSEVEAAVIPRKESIERCNDEYAELDREETAASEREAEIEKRLLDLQKQLEEIKYGGAVPTELELDDVRAQRQNAWGLLRRQWLEGEDVEAEAAAFDPDHALPEAFEHRLGAADDLADRLRREASRVQNQAAFIAEKSQCEAELEGIRVRLEECAKDRKRLDEEWQALWRDSGVAPLTPTEMKAWREDMEKLKEAVTELTQSRLKLESLKDSRTALIDSLREELVSHETGLPEDADLAAALLAAEDTVEKLEDTNRRREKLAEDIDRLVEKLEEVKNQVQAADEASRNWAVSWQKAISDLGQDADALPGEVDQTMQELVALFEKVEKIKELNQRIEGIERDARVLADEASISAQRVSPENAGLPIEELIRTLKRVLDSSVEQDTTRREIESQITALKQRESDAAEVVESMARTLEQLCKEAGCDSPDALEAAESNSIALARATAELTALENELLDIGEGLSLEDLETQVKAVDPDTLVGDIDELQREIEQDLEPRQTELAEFKGQQTSELGQMDGKDDASALAEQGQRLLEGIRSRVGRYTRVKLAARVLRDEIERYRQENQGPLIERASVYFAALTCRSFSGVATEYEEGDQVVLVGVRPDESRVGVEGMSSGTRDQLYLSLRLASIEKYLASGETMPFIVDDILIHFDDDRSRAALGVLAEFAKRTQVILFTHHRRLVEQVQELAATAQIKVHELVA